MFTLPTSVNNCRLFQMFNNGTYRKAWHRFLASSCLGSIAFIKYMGIYEVLYVLALRCLLTPVVNTTEIKQETEGWLGARLGFLG